MILPGSEQLNHEEKESIKNFDSDDQETQFPPLFVENEFQGNSFPRTLIHPMNDTCKCNTNNNL